MFLAVDHSKQVTSDYPANCTFRESDWHILSAYWHPVAYAHEIEDKPVAAKLLDVKLVIYRTSQGITVAKDLCMHRGAQISMGWMDNDNIVCPMHGLNYNAEGTCTKIPCMGADARIPDKLRLKKYLTEEKYGIIWVCLQDEPAQDLVNWEALNDGKLKRVFIPSGTWHASASRHVENFNDLAHFPWVHPETFGGNKNATLPIYEVERTDYGLTFQIPYVERTRMATDASGHDDEKTKDLPETRNVIYTYELNLPFTSYIKVDCQDYEFINHVYDTVCPVSANETKIFQIMTDNTGETSDEFWIKDSLQINNEDAPIVEGQCPEEIPLDLREEIHLPCDRFSLEFRRLLASLGLGAALTS